MRKPRYFVRFGSGGALEEVQQVQVTRNVRGDPDQLHYQRIRHDFGGRQPVRVAPRERWETRLTTEADPPRMFVEDHP